MTWRRRQQSFVYHDAARVPRTMQFNYRVQCNRSNHALCSNNSSSSTTTTTKAPKHQSTESTLYNATRSNGPPSSTYAIVFCLANLPLPPVSSSPLWSTSAMCQELDALSMFPWWYRRYLAVSAPCIDRPGVHNGVALSAAFAILASSARV